MNSIVTIFSTNERIIWNSGTSIKVILAGITIIEEKGAIDDIVARGLSGLLVSDKEIKKGIMIRIIIGN